MFLLKISFDIEFQIAVAWNALKRYFRPAIDFAKSVLA